MSLDDGDGLVMEFPDRRMYNSAFGGGAARSSTTKNIWLRGHPMVSATFRIADLAAVTAVAAIVSFLVDSEDPSRRHGLALVAFAVVLSFCVFPRAASALEKATASRLVGHVGYLGQLFPALACSTIAAALGFAFIGWRWPSLIAIAVGWGALNAVALVIARLAGYHTLTHPRVNQHIMRKVAVIGSDDVAWRIASLCQSDRAAQIRLLGVFSDDATKDPMQAEGQRLSGSVDELIALSRDTLLDDIIIAIPPGEDAAQRAQDLRWRLRGVATEVYLLPYLTSSEDALPMERFGPFSLAVVQRRPLTHGQALWKRGFDLVSGLVLLLMLFPVLAVVALAVKLDSPGPILFRQPRLGLNDRTFTILKFRSMYASSTDIMAARQTSKEDARVTRVGKWLRKLSLDELPQLFNVLSGDMSLVGPRPHAPSTRAGGQLLKDVMAEYVVRHQVKPGITGWAQINGSRGELVTTEDLRRRVTFDLEYIQRWSLWLDIKIVVLTVLREVFSKHAF